jgi:hypothetical protein
VDPRLLAAWAALAPGGVAAAVALRCEELLAGMAPLLQVLRMHCPSTVKVSITMCMVSSCDVVCDLGEGRYDATKVSSYREFVLGAGPAAPGQGRRGGARLLAAAAAGADRGAAHRLSAEVPAHCCAANEFASHLAMPTSYAPAMQAVQAVADSSSAAPRDVSAADVDIADSSANGDGWRRHIESLAGLSSGVIDASIEAKTLAASSPHMSRMLLRFRVSKKLLLWSVLLVQHLQGQPKEIR